ncbi:MAG: SWIM zinc finger family protein [Sulfolobaceae archaeon]
MENWKYLRRAKKAVLEGRIVEVIIKEFSIYFFLGHKYDYIVTANSCSCKYFLYNFKCYHILALSEALKEEKVKRISITPQLLKEILIEIYTDGKSLKLRRLVYSDKT